MTCNISIAAAIMVKNEVGRIIYSCKSVQGKSDGIILCDTGSTDDTIAVVREYATKNNMSFFLKQISFSDFSSSRNEMLDFADSLPFTHILLLDSNDELHYVETENKDIIDPDESDNKTNNMLVKTIQNNPEQKAFMIRQKWFIGNGKFTTFYNVRLITNKSGFRYKGSVHEYLNIGSHETCKVENLLIYQDRVADNDGKTKKRWESDIAFLKKDLVSNPDCTRTLYYLAQTYDCLDQNNDAFYFYKKRTGVYGFVEERFLSMLRCAKYEHEHDDKVLWCLKAFELLKRSEPLVFLAKLYRCRSEFVLAFWFAKIACSLPFPKDCVLFIDEKLYKHDRWQELSISSFYVEEFQQGKEACKRAIESGFENELNLKNLSFYD